MPIRSRRKPSLPKLSDLGVSKTQSSPLAPRRPLSVQCVIYEQFYFSRRLEHTLKGLFLHPAAARERK